LAKEKTVLQSLIDNSNSELKKKEEKENTLKQFVAEADDTQAM
jgi:hypothetical protein